MTIVSFTPTQASLNLTTTDRVKEELDIQHSDEDARIGRLIARASQRIATHLQRELRQGVVVETLEPVNDSRIILRVTPVKSVSAVLEDGSTVVAGTDGYLLESKSRGALYRRIRWAQQLPLLHGISYTFSGERGEEIYQVTYVGGYFLPSWTGPPAVGDVLLPEDIEHAAIGLVRSFFYRRDRNPEIASERLGDWSASYRDNLPHGLPPDVAAELSQHRRAVQA